MKSFAGPNALPVQLAADPAAAATGLRHGQALAEIDAVQRGTVSWTSGALTLLVSLLLFLGADAAGRWTVTLWLVPVLLFHELGHCVAMRAFRYRDPGVFFIPFLGAALGGRHYTVAGWQKALVYLMGPVPGILVGGAIGVVGPLLGLTWARDAGLLWLVINGLNLLPLLPLDGGWVVHTLLFSRHHRLEGAFQLAAAAALAAAGIRCGDVVLGLLAALLLAGARTSCRTARIAHDLRAEGVSAASPDDQTIPPAVAQTIIDRLAETFPASNARVLAQRTLQVFDGINARPPGWPAALALGAAYTASLVAAAGLTLVVGIGPEAIADAVHRFLPPPWSLDEGAVRGAATARFPAAGGRDTVVATFASAAAARDALLAAQTRPPAGADTALFGQSLLLSAGAGDAAARQWVAAAAGGAAETLRSTPDHPVAFTLTCTAASNAAATALAGAASEFFDLPVVLRLVPPWGSPDPRSAEERARHRRARQMFARLPPDLPPTQSIDVATLATALGALPAGDCGAGGGVCGQFAGAGAAWADGRLVRVEAARFEDLFHGPAALAAWLRANACTDPHYRFEATAREAGRPS